MTHTARPIELPSPEEARTIRLRAGLSQEKLAQRIGCSLKSVNAWELGHVTPSDLLGMRYLEELNALRREHE